MNQSNTTPFVRLQLDTLRQLNKLGPHAALVYLNLAAHVNRKKGYANPTHDRLMRDTGMSRSSVVRSVRALEDAGLIQVEHHHRVANHYRLNGVSNELMNSSPQTPLNSPPQTPLAANGVSDELPVVHHRHTNQIEIGDKREVREERGSLTRTYAPAPARQPFKSFTRMREEESMAAIAEFSRRQEEERARVGLQSANGKAVGRLQSHTQPGNDDVVLGETFGPQRRGLHSGGDGPD